MTYKYEDKQPASIIEICFLAVLFALLLGSFLVSAYYASTGFWDLAKGWIL